MKSLVRLNTVHYSVDKQTLERDDGDSVTLDPKVGLLLDYFLHQRDRIISRDELLDNVWPGVVVNDNTVSWAISQLRKALGDSAQKPQFIRTVPKRGYEWIADTEAIPTDTAISPNDAGQQANTSSADSPIDTGPSHSNSRHSKRVIIACIAVIATAAVLALIWTRPPSTAPQISNIRNLSHSPGLETSPAISPDSEWLLFLHRAPDSPSFDLKLKPMLEPRRFQETDNTGPTERTIASQRDQAAFSLEYPANVVQAIWGDNSHRIFAVEKSSDACHIVELHLPLARDRIDARKELERCDPEAASTLRYDPQSNTLYFTDRREGDHYRVYRRTLPGGLAEALTTPESAGLGDHFIDYSPDHSDLLVLRYSRASGTDFLRLDPDSGELETLFTIGDFYFSAYWGVGGDSVWFNWSNQQVFRYLIGEKRSELILKSSFGWNYDARPVSDGRALFLVSPPGASDFIQIQDGNPQREATPYTESLPVFSNDGTLAFVSDQSGLPQFWIQRNGGPAQQMSNLLEFKNFIDLSWSADGSRLIGITDGQVGSIDLKTESYRLLYQGKQSPHQARLASDNETLWLATDAGLLRSKLGNEPISDSSLDSVVTANIAFFDLLGDDEVVFNRTDEQGLWRWSSTSGVEPLSIPADAGRFFLWRDNRVYTTHGSNLERWNPGARQAELRLPVNMLLIKRFAVDQNDRWVVDDWRRTESNIAIGDLSTPP